MKRRHWLATVMTLPWLAACSRDDPQASLEAAVQQLQDALEARDASAVMAMLDARFRAQDELDAEWAERTMRLMFLRYAQVRVVAIGRRSVVDPQAAHLGRTEAQVLVAGAQDLIPERVTPYTVELQWRRQGKDWRLYDLRWR
jgi:hypothetical protein